MSIMTHMTLDQELFGVKMQWDRFECEVKRTRELLAGGGFMSREFPVIFKDASPCAKLLVMDLLQALWSDVEWIEYVMRSKPGLSWRIRHRKPDGSTEENKDLSDEMILEMARLLFNVGEPVECDTDEARKGVVRRRAVAKTHNERIDLEMAWFAMPGTGSRDPWLEALDVARNEPSIPNQDNVPVERLIVRLKHVPLET